MTDWKIVYNGYADDNISRIEDAIVIYKQTDLLGALEDFVRDLRLAGCSLTSFQINEKDMEDD
jgi:hypothetical protein